MCAHRYGSAARLHERSLGSVARAAGFSCEQGGRLCPSGIRGGTLDFQTKRGQGRPKKEKRGP
eukprot:1746253-Amphidinium_carterae.1